MAARATELRQNVPQKEKPVLFCEHESVCNLVERVIISDWLEKENCVLGHLAQARSRQWDRTWRRRLAPAKDMYVWLTLVQTGHKHLDIVQLLFLVHFHVSFTTTRHALERATNDPGSRCTRCVHTGSLAAGNAEELDTVALCATTTRLTSYLISCLAQHRFRVRAALRRFALAKCNLRGCIGRYEIFTHSCTSRH